MAILVGVHVVAGVFAWGLDSGYGAAIIDLTGRDSYMALAFVGALIIGAVTITSTSPGQMPSPLLRSSWGSKASTG
jgi:hypothetical protein